MYQLKQQQQQQQSTTTLKRSNFHAHLPLSPSKRKEFVFKSLAELRMEKRQRLMTSEEGSEQQSAAKMRKIDENNNNNYSNKIAASQAVPLRQKKIRIRPYIRPCDYSLPPAELANKIRNLTTAIEIPKFSLPTFHKESATSLSGGVVGKAGKVKSQELTEKSSSSRKERKDKHHRSSASKRPKESSKKFN